MAAGVRGVAGPDVVADATGAAHPEPARRRDLPGRAAGHRPGPVPADPPAAAPVTVTAPADGAQVATAAVDVASTVTDTGGATSVVTVQAGQDSTGGWLAG